MVGVLIDYDYRYSSYNKAIYSFKQGMERVFISL